MLTPCNYEIIDWILTYNILYISFLYMLIPTISYGQDQWQGEGEIEEAEVIIEKDRKIVLPRARRIFERVPPFAQSQGILGLQYSYVPVNFAPGMLNTRIRPLTVQSEP